MLPSEHAPSPSTRSGRGHGAYKFIGTASPNMTVSVLGARANVSAMLFPRRHRQSALISAEYLLSVPACSDGRGDREFSPSRPWRRYRLEGNIYVA